LVRGHTVKQLPRASTDLCTPLITTRHWLGLSWYTQSILKR